LADKQLQQNLLDLAKKCGVHIKQVFEVQLSTDTEKANAAVAGTGKNRRILLADTLLKNFSNEQIEAVFAHELAHIALRHWLKLTVFGTAVSLTTFYLTYLFFKPAAGFFGFSTVHDLAAFPLLLLVLTAIALVLIPLQNIYLRYLEKQADIFALSRVAIKEGFISAMKKLADQNLSDPSPGRIVEFLFYTHPPIAKRIRYAGAYS
ncbi:MAG TPA: M48 family metalloprotease, partial [Sedimentisphaerales bacterium]|nr:M48 family metalloprotease [Sedimentisphaerales bacterium]